MDVEKLVDMALDTFYLYLGSLPDGRMLQQELELVCETLDKGELSQQASEAAARLAELASDAPLLAEEIVEVLGEVSGMLKPF
jgi:hypothetical protein